jgi:hypothetical protein
MTRDEEKTWFWILASVFCTGVSVGMLLALLIMWVLE